MSLSSTRLYCELCQEFCLGFDTHYHMNNHLLFTWSWEWAFSAGSIQTEKVRLNTQSELRRGPERTQLLRSMWSEPCPQMGGSTWREHNPWRSSCPGEEMEGYIAVWAPGQSDFNSQKTASQGSPHPRPTGPQPDKSPPTTQTLAREGKVSVKTPPDTGVSHTWHLERQNAIWEVTTRRSTRVFSWSLTLKH
jgi:hypothetical protein